MNKLFYIKKKKKYYTYNPNSAMLERTVLIGSADIIKKGKVLCCASPVVIKNTAKTTSNLAKQVSNDCKSNPMKGFIIKQS